MISARSFSIQYRILDAKNGVPKRPCTVFASPKEIHHLAEEGYLVRRRLFSKQSVLRLQIALDEVLATETLEGGSKINRCFEAAYMRNLLDKHAAFKILFRLKVTASIARAVLGPQIRFDEVTARISDLKFASASAPWHIHRRVVPDPLPPFFVYPHSVECLLYLDDADEVTGRLCVLPGSHREINRLHPADDTTDKPNQELLTLKAGDCVIFHTNLWHRVMPSQIDTGTRRLIIFGYQPSWVSGEEHGGAKQEGDALRSLQCHNDPLIRELAGEFFWG